MEQRLEVAVFAEVLGQRIADEGDAFALDELQGDLARRQRGAGQTRPVLEQFRARQWLGLFLRFRFLLWLGRFRGRWRRGGERLAGLRLAEFEIGHLQAAAFLQVVFDKAEEGRLVFIDDGDIRLRGHLEIQSPEDPVHHQAAQPFVLQIRRGAHRGGEHFVGFAFFVLHLPRPDHRHHRVVHRLLHFVDARFFVIRGRGVRLEGGQHFAADQDLRVGLRLGFIDIGHAEEIAHPAQHRIVLRSRLDDALGSFHFMMGPSG